MNTIQSTAARRTLEIRTVSRNAPEPGEEFNLALWHDKATNYRQISALRPDAHRCANTMNPGDAWTVDPSIADATFEYIGRFEFVERRREDAGQFDTFIEIENPHYALTATVQGVERSARAAGIDVAESMLALFGSADKALQNA